MRIENGLSWMVAGGALVAAAGCTADDEHGRVTAMYATMGDGSASALRGLAVDRRTHEQLVHALGGQPADIELSGDAPDGTVQVQLAPTSPLIPAYLPSPSSPTLPPLSITFEDGSTEPVALLLPAIQKVREAAIHGSGTGQLAGTLAVTFDGMTTVGGGVHVAVGDVTGDGTDARDASVFVVATHAPGVAPEQRTAMADALVSPTSVQRARLDGAKTDFVLGELAIPDPDLLGRWTNAGTTMNLVVDVRLDDGILTRFRVPRATVMGPDESQPQAGAHVRVFDSATAPLTRDGDAERAMFDAGYATFSTDAFDQAARVLATYVDTATTSMAIATWTSGRTQALADLVAATGAGGAPGYEAMACAAALPTAVAVANGLDLRDDGNASAAATTLEAATSIAPKVGLVAGGTLAMQTHGATAPSGDAELACAAIHQLASLPDTLATAEGKAIRQMAVELAAFDARYLEIEIAAWIDAMDALVLVPDDTAWTAARGKADILIESLGNAATRTQARWALAKTLLGR